MKTTKKPIASGVINTIELKVTPQQIDRLNGGREKAHNIFRHLSPRQTAFLISGVVHEDCDLALNQFVRNPNRIKSKIKKQAKCLYLNN
tara:strand:+ start:573 stop:839 length:267 start_codon:yes stop_codon:yes gene_type:complete